MKILETILVDLFILKLSLTQDDIRLPPSITRGPPRNLIYRSNGSITLNCKGTGVPNVTYEWKKNGIELNETLQNIQRGADGTITIHPATPMDEGFYQCFVRNQYGRALSIITTHVQWAFLGSTTRNTTDVLNKAVYDGLPFYIPCNPRRSFPNPTYIWEMANGTEDKNPILLQPSNRIQIAENGDLHFAYARMEDDLGGRLYRCTTYNAYLGVKEGGRYTQLTVEWNPCFVESPYVPAPCRRRRSLRHMGFFSESPTVAVVGRSVTLRCFFYWNRNSTISWSVPWYSLPAGRHTLNDFHTSLTIDNITASDEGDYSCSVTIIVDKPTLRIRVEAEPTFPTVNDAPYDVNVTEGESITFKCNATAKPVAKIVWLQDGKELDPNNPPKRFMFSNDNRSLTIRDVCRDCDDRESKTDLMVIQCNASNVHGYVFAQGYLNVLSKTIVTVNGERYNRQRIVIESSESKEIPYRVTSDPSTPPSVWWYSKWRKIENDGEHSVPIDLLTFTLENGSLIFQVNPNATRKWTTHLGEYELIAGNGYSNDSATFDIILTGLCARECFLNAISSEPNCNVCFDSEFMELLYRVSDLDVTALKNQFAIAEIVSQLAALTSKSEGLSPGNLNASVMILNRLAFLRSGSEYNPTKGEIQSFVEATSNVLQQNNFKSWKELEAVNASFATAILFSVDVYGRSLSMLNISGCNKEEGDNLVLEAQSLEKSNLPRQPEFPNCSVWDKDSGNRISISREALESSNSSESQPTFNMWAVYYRTINDYLPGNKDFGNIISKVQSLSIDGLKHEEKLDRPVLITLQHNQEESLSFRRTCTFWNFNRGDWDSSGCSVMSTSLTHTICSCDHLTNFAILMSKNPSDDKALSIFSLIGCIISIVALILTIIVYALTWKHSKSAQATVLLNLCVALIIAYIIFIAGAHKVNKSEVYDNNPGKTPQDGCRVVAVLLHYFFLAAFFMMLAEGVELLIYIVFVFHVRRTRETIMLVAAAWVLPLIIVAVSLGSTQLQGYGNEKACWLSVKNGLIWAFVGPVLCIITVNFVILAVVLRWMSKRRSFLANNSEKRDEIRATLWNLSVTCPVLGLGWLFGVFSIAVDHEFVQYLFVIANSLQGLLIFIFHALLHNKTAKEKISYFYSNYICGCRKTANGVSNKMSSTQELAKKPEKPGFVPVEVHDNKGMEKEDILLSTGTQTTSIDDSGAMESTH